MFTSFYSWCSCYSCWHILTISSKCSNSHFCVKQTISYLLTIFDISNVLLCTLLTRARRQICWGNCYLETELYLNKGPLIYIWRRRERTLTASLIKTNGGGVFLICSTGWMSFHLIKSDIKPLLGYPMAFYLFPILLVLPWINDVRTTDVEKFCFDE